MFTLLARSVATAVLCIAAIAGDVAAEVGAPPTRPHAAASDDVGARLVPTVRDGRAVGVKAFAIRPDSALARLRVEAGDLITHVRGVAVTGAAPIVEAIRAHAGGAALELTIVRAGVPRSLRAP